MLAEAIPALWSSVHGWFTPAVFFVVLNIVIGTIAVTSKAAAPAASADEGEQPRRLARVPSMAFDRLRSFNLRFAAAEPESEAAVAGVADLGYEQPPEPEVVMLEEEEPARVVERDAQPEPEPDPEPEHAAPPPSHVERSRSEAAGAGAERPRLPARLLKSASDKSAFSHLGAEEVEETVRAVEARRPATARERAAARRAPVAEAESSESEDEVDARADAFISRFRHQLKLQRIDSFIRNRETIHRGQAAAAGV